MIPSSKKRAAPESPSSSSAKRLRTPASNTPEISSLGSSFIISIGTCEDLSVYPEKLLRAIQDQNASLTKLVMSKFETGTPLQRRYEYAITRKCVSKPRSSETDYSTPRIETYSSASYANEQVLLEFLRKVPTKKKFVEMSIPGNEKPVANPAFAELQSANPGWLNWGFDMWGCISLLLTTIEGGKQKQESMYVQRRELEVTRIIEDDDVRLWRARTRRELDWGRMHH